MLVKPFYPTTSNLQPRSELWYKKQGIKQNKVKENENSITNNFC